MTDDEAADRERTVRLHATTDATVWAKEWIAAAAAIVARTGSFVGVLDERWMTSWIANAIETGRNAGRSAMLDEMGDPAQWERWLEHLAVREPGRDAMIAALLAVPEGQQAVAGVAARMNEEDW